MNCEDLLNMKQIRKGMKLVAGEKGLDKTVRWIYFADCVQCLSKDFNVAELIHGEELVIVTNESLDIPDRCRACRFQFRSWLFHLKGTEIPTYREYFLGNPCNRCVRSDYRQTVRICN